MVAETGWAKMGLVAGVNREWGCWISVVFEEWRRLVPWEVRFGGG